MLSVLASDHFEISRDVREELAGELRNRGYSGDHESPYFVNWDSLSQRPARIEHLRTVRRSNVLETDPFYERMLGVSGKTSRISVAHIDYSFDAQNTYLSPKYQRGAGPTGMFGLQMDPRRPVDDLGYGDTSHADHCMGLLSRQLTDATAIPVASSSLPENQAQMVGAMRFAASSGAQVVTLSSLVDYDPAEILAVMSEYPDVLFIKAAGNDGADVSSKDTEDLIAGSALRNLAVLANSDGLYALNKSSNYSAEFVTHAMGGTNLMSFGAESTLVEMSGTSMAGPNFGNLAAKVRTLCPELKPEEVKDLLAVTTSYAPELKDKVRSGGVTLEERALLLATAVGMEGSSAPGEATAPLRKHVSAQALLQLNVDLATFTEARLVRIPGAS